MSSAPIEDGRHSLRRRKNQLELVLPYFTYLIRTLGNLVPLIKKMPVVSTHLELS